MPDFSPLSRLLAHESGLELQLGIQDCLLVDLLQATYWLYQDVFTSSPYVCLDVKGLDP